MNKSNALVVGAGPTGMMMAIGLKRAGVDVRIIDKSDHQALHSQALIIQARTLEHCPAADGLSFVSVLATPARQTEGMGGRVGR